MSPLSVPLFPRVTTTPSPLRLETVDLLRGLVMVLMALDHARDFFGFTPFDPTDLDHTTPLLFSVRWITHLCAPVFVFLAGASAALSIARGKPRALVARILLVRGLWLIFLEFTLIRAAWFLGFAADYTYRFAFVQVIWVIGWSMIALSALIFLPRWLMFAVSFAIVVGHNAFDHVDPASWGRFSAVWKLLHVSTGIDWRFGAADVDHVLFVRYPLIPWPAVMALGYLAAPLFQSTRRWQASAIGLAMILVAVVLRLFNSYGDPNPWAVQSSTLHTVMSFINVQKYPPSLLYLLATIGPTLAILPALHRLPDLLRNWLTVYGGAPMLFYIAHLFALQFSMIAVTLIMHGSSAFKLQQPPNFGMWAVFLAWAGVVAALYFPCRWFGALKKRRPAWWHPLI